MTGNKTIIPFWATLFTIAGVIILCALGTWQLQRLQWKNEIIEKLHAAYENPIDNLNLSTLKDDNFVYASITGRFLFEQSILLGHTIKDEQPGKFLMTPMETEQGTLLVNMGFNPNTQPLETHALKAYQGQFVTLAGLIRKPTWNSFTPENNPENDLWYRADIAQIAAAKNLENPIPFLFYADHALKELSTEFPNNERWEPSNNHARYAIFWFTMAGAFMLVYYLRFFKKAKC